MLTVKWSENNASSCGKVNMLFFVVAAITISEGVELETNVRYP